MTHRTTESHDQAAPASAGASPASIRQKLAALLAQDDIVRPELRNAAILGAQPASRVTHRDDRHHHTLARRS
ncbi:hypothetical protein [Halomonas daqiaonensis]|uniref:Uncharacterized protein n=1 Tax=Halomonas daqiaonensis TaxID=650850 RepID=A0A1H7UFG9_9GAMM|nr:hypothetical protein [Halomonas daqiaonensis]SEL95475.1 hypothetical protein SAMN04488129_12036 [Halomonas daqiaonensis]